jgi:phosphoribosylamine---glycine ligase
MKVLVIGAGGREHAIAWAIARSPHAPEIHAAPGNAGLVEVGRLVPIAATDVEALHEYARREAIDLTIVGPEAPLVSGIVDRFRDAGLRVFGPRARAARLEGSKIFSKDFMRRHAIPTAPYVVCGSLEEAEAALARASYPRVIKADGLAAGKGVVIARSHEEAAEAARSMLEGGRFGDAGRRILVEEFIEGEEVSVFALCRGTEYFLLPVSQDHKRLRDGDEGPNTGGMGAYAPVPRWTEALESTVRREVIEPTLAGLLAEDRAYHGLLYTGLILRNGRPYVLEYNCRFGDPETQVVLPLVEGDLLDVLDAIASESRGAIPSISVRRGAVATVVLASGGYPEAYAKGLAIRGIPEAQARPGVHVFHAGTKIIGGDVVTDGGRVLCVTGVGADLQDALARAYDGVSRISFEGMVYRADIGRRGLA